MIDNNDCQIIEDYDDDCQIIESLGYEESKSREICDMPPFEISDEMKDIYSNVALPEDFNYGANDIEAALTLNEVETYLINNLIEKVQTAKVKNKEKQITLNFQHLSWEEKKKTEKAKIEISMYHPPYFKDEYNMTAPMNKEAKHKLENCNFNPLERQETEWNKTDITLLKESVRQAMVEKICSPLCQRLEILTEKHKNSGIETSQKQACQWRREIAELSKEIAYEKKSSLEDLDRRVNANDLDWIKMSFIDFKNRRTPISLRLKWLNEVSPRWSKEKWTVEEDRRLKDLVEGGSFISWASTAEELKSGRTPWQCFERYKSKLQVNKKGWTTEEDEKLMTIANMCKTVDGVHWPKVVFYMPGRTLAECKERYRRTLNASLKRGAWTADEDLLLISAVSKWGSGKWDRIAKCVPNRNNCQCRERWTYIVEVEKNMQRKWTIEEDETLILLIRIIGRGFWGKCRHFFENRSGDSIRNRHAYLLHAKIRMADSFVKHDVNSSRGNRSMVEASGESYEKALLAKVNDYFLGTQMNQARLQEMIQDVVAVCGESKRTKRSELTKEEIYLISKNIKEASMIYRVNNEIDMNILLDLLEVTEKDLDDYHRKRNRELLRSEQRKAISANTPKNEESMAKNGKRSNGRKTATKQKSASKNDNHEHKRRSSNKSAAKKKRKNTNENSTGEGNESVAQTSTEILDVKPDISIIRLLRPRNRVVKYC